MPLLTLDEAKTLLNITVSTYDDELPDYIAAAQECVDFLCGPSEPVTITETVSGDIEIALSTTPVLSVTSISGQYTGVRNMDTVWVNLAAGTIRANRGGAFPIQQDYYDVTYVAGRETVPLSIKQGIRIILAHQWTIRRGLSTSRPNMGGDDSSMVAGLGYAIPNRALQILAPYMLGPSVG